MSYFICKHCGEKNEIGINNVKLDLPVLAKLPFFNDLNAEKKESINELKIAVSKIISK